MFIIIYDIKLDTTKKIYFYIYTYVYIFIYLCINFLFICISINMGIIQAHMLNTIEKINIWVITLVEM